MQRNWQLMRKTRRSLKALSKWLRSFTKTAWDFEDYPIEIRMQRMNPDDTELPKYAARIIHWPPMVGLGETGSEALDDLREAFARHAKDCPLPRPGTRVPISFASTDRISRFEALAADFFPPILGHEFSECFVSDESSLMDFGEEWQDYCARILLRYEVDISDMEPGNLVHIFERIEACRRAN
ncbi:MAG: hypothetical protein FWD77_00835 [Betaproteobacteria bacterium]|nr:hypothetical protein [Betaproteobacteria bacterium]